LDRRHQSRRSTWTRNVAALGGGLGAIENDKGEVTLQLVDMHGDVVSTVENDPEAANVLSTQRFDEFGNPLQSEFLEGGSTEYGWLGGKGRRTQLPSGVIQMGIRSYVPALGRFLTPDPSGAVRRTLMTMRTAIPSIASILVANAR
jgi:hypothetical protein